MVRALLLCLLLAGCATLAPPQPQVLQGESMGSTWTVKLDADPSRLPALRDGIQRQLDAVVAQMSTWEEDSSLSRFNAAPAGHVQTLEPEFARVLGYALQLAADTGGAYDPTIGPLVNLWGFGPDGRRAEPPTDEMIAAAKARVGWQRLRFDADDGTLVQPGGAYLDLSSIATGFGIEQVAGWLQAQDVDNFLVELGGELRAGGRRPDGGDWRVGIERPTGEDGAPLLHTLGLRDEAIGASGDFRNFFEHRGQRYSHHIDPRTGETVTRDLASVQVIHADGMKADALAMAITALGPDKGFAWAEQHGLAALLVLRDGDGFRERMTPAFRKALAR